MIEDMIRISVILRAKGLDLEPLRGLEKALRLIHELGAHRVHHGDACKDQNIDKHRCIDKEKNNKNILKLIKIL